MTLELSRVRIFDVLRNALTGELAVVMSVSGDRLDLRDKSGAVACYKFGEHFTRVTEDEATSFRTELLALRKSRQPARKRRARTVASVLRRFAKKR